MKINIKHLLIHLRFPFSLFLLPVFLFGLSQNLPLNFSETLLLFIVLHLLVYPSSNGYNSYMDNDTESIGGIKNPPKVPKAMFATTLMMDFIALVLTYSYFGILISAFILAYILASRAYSYRGIRIKKYPVIGFVYVAFFQGSLIYLICFMALNPNPEYDFILILSMIISFLLVGAGYPLTQVYQHKQDKVDGVKTLSILLGIKGTFNFSTVLFALLGLLIGVYFIVLKESVTDAVIFYVAIAPVFWYFNHWKNKVFKDPKEANFENNMRMNKIGSFALNLLFLILLFKNLYFI